MKSGKEWHPATDGLSGFDAYGTYIDDPQHDSTFSKSWDNSNVSHFLFSTGDASKWLVATEFAVIGQHYIESDKREILQSSSCPSIYKAVWYNREGHLEVLYVGNSYVFSNNAAADILTNHNGANVWIRNLRKPLI